MHGAFGRSAVVTGEVDDERVVEKLAIVESIQHSVDLEVGVSEEPRKRLHEASGHRSVALRIVSPRWNALRSFG